VQVHLHGALGHVDSPRDLFVTETVQTSRAISRSRDVKGFLLSG
jgi:hypothetical protein